MFLPKKISLPPYVFYMLGKTTISFTVTYFQRAFSPGEVYQRIYLDSSAGKIIVFFSHIIRYGRTLYSLSSVCLPKFSKKFGGNREGGNTLETTLSDKDTKDLSHLRLHGTRIRVEQRSAKPSALYMLFDHSIIKQHH